ncbi:hypothetical protein AWH56_015615 [Anaerobacillus isosaccharinicus]|uniref:Uncharacterized protein n=1 Tax=Anaerobacillus isosaccharinicus TaxID=1532552 RepID=A0A1S2L9C2_9BACI|nr:hypothetical protein [Anaerobacillus isosaccharinicus]MBA5587672.1 hypothetical protein [Anaerobacillus isosaccharinicus]QOY34156.1 hypothetical protein AWH56_015615 [Anaerobacillus isosaccharinicus]
MEENKQHEPYRGRSYFDSLMFGPPRRPVIPTEDQKATNEPVVDTQQVAEDPIETQKKEQPKQPIQENQNVNPKEQPQVDFVQMMQQFDTLMDYANKLGPSFKKMGPLFDLFKGFNNKK